MYRRSLSAASVLLSLIVLGACRSPQQNGSFLVEYDRNQLVVTVLNAPPDISPADLADLIGRKAIEFRKELAMEFIGEEVPPFPERMPILADLGPNQGATEYSNPQSHGATLANTKCIFRQEQQTH